jgi:hypothetical protein
VLINVEVGLFQSDAAAAGKWLKQLPDDAAKQQVVQNYINNVSRQNPELAVPWVETLTEPNQRNNAIRNLARNWLRTDPTAAEKWLDSTDLPDQQKAQLLKSVSR